MTSPPPLSVGQYTPRAPFTVGPHEPLGNARRLMSKYALRELPVRAEGRLVGLLSERDLRLLWSLSKPPPEALPVETAMAADPYIVASDSPLGEVVRTMIARDAGAAVVVEQDRVVGVFTARDAMEALVDVLEPKRTRADRRVQGTHAPRAPRSRDSR